MISKAIFPVAGLGSRFLPVTKASPKEMMAIVDKPLIQYAVEEAIAAGINQLIFVTNHTKRAIEDHFERNIELEFKLNTKKNQHLINKVKNILPSKVTCIYLRQSEPLGLGHAVLCAKKLIGDEPFAVLLADDLIDSHQHSCLQQMITKFQSTSNSIVAVEKVSPSAISRYGIVDPLDLKSKFSQISNIIEKPRAQNAPSNLGVVGRYILTPSIFKYLELLKHDNVNELQLTDLLFYRPPYFCNQQTGQSNRRWEIHPGSAPGHFLSP